MVMTCLTILTLYNLSIEIYYLSIANGANGRPFVNDKYKIFIGSALGLSCAMILVIFITLFCIFCTRCSRSSSDDIIKSLIIINAFLWLGEAGTTALLGIASCSSNTNTIDYDHKNGYAFQYLVLIPNCIIGGVLIICQFCSCFSDCEGGGGSGGGGGGYTPYNSDTSYTRTYHTDYSTPSYYQPSTAYPEPTTGTFPANHIDYMGYGHESTYL